MSTRAWFFSGAIVALGCGSPTSESGPDATTDGKAGEIATGDDANGATEGGGVTDGAGSPDSDGVVEAGGAPGNCCARISANSFCTTAPNQCCAGGIACP